MGVLIGIICLAALVAMAITNHSKGIALRKNTPFWCALALGGVGIATFAFLLLEQGSMG